MIQSYGVNCGLNHGPPTRKHPCHETLAMYTYSWNQRGISMETVLKGIWGDIKHGKTKGWETWKVSINFAQNQPQLHQEMVCNPARCISKKNASRVTVSLMAAIPRKKKNLRFCHSPTSLFIFELVTVIHIVSAKTNINEKTSDPSSLHFSESLLNTSTLLMHADASPKRSIFISPSVSTRLAVERNALRRGLARKRLPHRWSRDLIKKQLMSMLDTQARIVRQYS